MRTFRTAFVVCSLTATPAFAAQFTTPPLLYDSAGHEVGVPLWQNEIERKIGGHVYWMNVASSGFFNNAVFFYASGDCTGQAMIEDSVNWYIEPQAFFDGRQVWGPVPGAEVSLDYASYSYGGGCNQATGSTRAAPAQVIDTGTAAALVPPFVVR